MTEHTDIIVIGAGLAGLSAASLLKRSGRNVMVIDKGRGLGGRLAGRRIDDACFDHGAQFMTTRDSEFIHQVNQWISAGVAEEWYSSFPGQPNSHARYRGVPGMTAIAKHLAADINVKLATRVTAVAQEKNSWIVQMDNGQSLQSEALVITSPVPQSRELLTSSKIVLHPETSARLARIRYESCIAVMAILDQSSKIPSPGALVINQGPIAWIADNQQKGVSQIPAVTIHASGDFSADHFERNRQQVGRELIEAAGPYLDAKVINFQVHGWRYSKPTVTDESRCVLGSRSTSLPTLIFAGDAFGGPRVEGAFLSGQAAAIMLLKESPAESVHNKNV